MIPLLQKRWPPAAEVRIDGESIAVAVKVSSRARSYRLSLPHGGTPLLTVPRFGRWGEAKAFLERHTPWLADRLERSVKPVAFVRGAIVPLRGVNHRIVPTGKVRGVVEVGEHEGEMALLVPGAPEHRARRLTDWLVASAATAGVASVHVELRADNRPAYALYRKTGFIETLRLQGYYRGRETAIRMMRLLRMPGVVPEAWSPPARDSK